jgi:hypothetical protein
MDKSLYITGTGSTLDVYYCPPIVLDDGWECVIGLVSLDVFWKAYQKDDFSTITIVKDENDHLRYSPPAPKLPDIKLILPDKDRNQYLFDKARKEEDDAKKPPIILSSPEALTLDPHQKVNDDVSKIQDYAPPTPLKETDSMKYITIPSGEYTIEGLEMRINDLLLPKHGYSVLLRIQLDNGGFIKMKCTKPFTFHQPQSMLSTLGYDGQNKIIYEAGQWHKSSVPHTWQNAKVLIEEGINDRFYYFISKSDIEDHKPHRTRSAINGTIWKTMVLTPGVYNISGLNALINSLGEGGAEFVVFRDKENHRNTITSNSILDFSDTASIGPSLKFPPEILTPYILYTSHITDECLLHPVKDVYVTCSIAGGSYINDRLSHSIYSFRVECNKSYKLHLSPPNITFFPVKRDRITHINISFYDEEGSPVRFEETIRVHLYLKHI